MTTTRTHLFVLITAALVLFSIIGVVMNIRTKYSVPRENYTTWSGQVNFEENIAKPACFYEGRITLKIPTSGNSASFSLELTNSKAVGTSQCWKPQQFPVKQIFIEQSDNTLSWSDSIVVFTGTILDNHMNIQFESCPQQRCSDGIHAKGIRGTGKLAK